MMINLLITFIILNVVNVVLQTIKSIALIKCGRLLASVINAIAYGLYTVCLVYMNCDLPLWAKVIVVGLANFIGVFVVRTVEDILRKDKLWKVEATILRSQKSQVSDALSILKVPCSVINIGSKYTKLEFYCSNKEQSARVRAALKEWDAKYFVSESKIL